MRVSWRDFFPWGGGEWLLVWEYSLTHKRAVFWRYLNNHSLKWNEELWIGEDLELSLAPRWRRGQRHFRLVSLCLGQGSRDSAKLNIILMFLCFSSPGDWMQSKQRAWETLLFMEKRPQQTGWLRDLKSFEREHSLLLGPLPCSYFRHLTHPQSFSKQATRAG